MSIIPWYYKLLGAFVLAGGIWVAGYYHGYNHEHDLRVSDAAKAAQAAQDQAALVIKLNKTIEDNADESAKDAQNVTSSIVDYYKQHPVIRLRYVKGGCSILPETSSDSQSSDGTSSAGYVSPYSPADTEQVAARLFQLQELLRQDGVTIK